MTDTCTDFQIMPDDEFGGWKLTKDDSSHPLSRHPDQQELVFIAKLIARNNGDAQVVILDRRGEVVHRERYTSSKAS